MNAAVNDGQAIGRSEPLPSVGGHLERADDGDARASRFEAVRRGWVGLTRPWDRLTTNTGVGFPHQATAEKGQRFLDVLVDRLATFLVELDAAEVDETFPFQAEEA